MKTVTATTYLKETFRSVLDAAHSVWFDASNPADRVAEYLEEYARTQGVRLTNTLEVAQDLLARLADPRVCQEEWSRYNRNAGDPLTLRESVIEPFGYAEILDYEGKIYGVRFPHQVCLVATAWDEPDLYEGEEARVMWQKYARHIAWLRHVCRGRIIWHTAQEDAEDHALFPLCAECTLRNELEWGTIFQVESGRQYDHSITCENCDVELAHCVLPEEVFLRGKDAVDALSGNCGICGEPLLKHYEPNARGDIQMYAAQDDQGEVIGFLCHSCAIDQGFEYAASRGEWGNNG